VFTIKQAAEVCGVEVRSLRGRVDRGSVAAVKVDGRRLVSRAELERVGLWPADRSPAPDAAPEDLDAEARRRWESTVAHLKAEDRWDPIFAPTVERYVRAEQRAREAREVLARTGMTARGSQGQPVEHPALQTERAAHRDAAAAERELLLTPASRRRFAMVLRRPGGGKFGFVFGENAGNSHA